MITLPDASEFQRGTVVAWFQENPAGTATHERRGVIRYARGDGMVAVEEKPGFSASFLHYTRLTRWDDRCQPLTLDNPPAKAGHWSVTATTPTP